MTQLIGGNAMPTAEETDLLRAGSRSGAEASQAAATNFLRTCLRARHDASLGAALRMDAGAIDWSSLAATIHRERLAPLLHRSLGPLGILPAGLARSLQQSYRATALRNLLLLGELRQCVAQLLQGGISAIVLKGAALAEPVYGNPALRPIGDLDVLVNRPDVEAVRRILEGRGYATRRAETHPGAIFEHESELVMWRPGRVRIDLDLHWSLIDSPYHQDRARMDWFWETARQAPIGGAPALTLGTEALLIHLCAHLALHHRGTGLLWWNDIAEVLIAQAGRIDWNEMAVRAHALGLLLPVRDVLARLASEWQAPVPAEVLRALSERRASRREARIVTRLSESGPAGRRFWADLAGMPTWRQRLRFARTNLLPSAAYMQRRYDIRHPLLLPLYYPYRWLRGALGRR